MSLAPLPPSRFSPCVPVGIVRWRVGVFPSTLELMVAPLALQMESCESACTLAVGKQGVCNFQNSLGSASRNAPQPQRGEDTGAVRRLGKDMAGWHMARDTSKRTPFKKEMNELWQV